MSIKISHSDSGIFRAGVSHQDDGFRHYLLACLRLGDFVGSIHPRVHSNVWQRRLLRIIDLQRIEFEFPPEEIINS